jgi:hypothetical protein
VRLALQRHDAATFLQNFTLAFRSTSYRDGTPIPFQPAGPAPSFKKLARLKGFFHKAALNERWPQFSPLNWHYK